MFLQVPDDALDLALNSMYTHSRDTLVSKIYVFIQPETLGRETWRVMRNEIKVLYNKYKMSNIKQFKIPIRKTNRYLHIFRFSRNRLNQIDRST